MDTPAPDGRLKRAFIEALAPQSSVAAVFTAELREALPWIAEPAAQQSAGDMLARRPAEQWADTIGRPKNKAHDDRLPDQKERELVKSLAQPRRDASGHSADAIIHIHANIRAQRELHDALASRVFRGGGPFEQALATALRQAEPGLPGTEADAAAAEFVRIRRERAQAIAGALSAGGAVEQQAVAMATRLRNKSDDSHPAVKKAKQREKLGEDIAFGLQQTFLCWATDFVDPYIGKWFQDKFKSEQHNGTLAHTWGGEIIGDTAAFFAYLGVRQFMPQSIEWLKVAALHAGDGFYDRMGRKSLSSWAEEHHVEEDSEVYRRKLQQWKEYQADNFAKASVISASSVVFNVATQKAMGNTHKLHVITASKVVGAAITMAAMLGLRFLIPKTTKEMDEELSDKYFAPVIRKTQKLFGTSGELPESPETERRETLGEHTERLVAKPFAASWDKAQ